MGGQHPVCNFLSFCILDGVGPIYKKNYNGRFQDAG